MVMYKVVIVAITLFSLVAEEHNKIGLSVLWIVGALVFDISITVLQCKSFDIAMLCHGSGYVSAYPVIN
jgi:hypothetical protein